MRWPGAKRTRETCHPQRFPPNSHGDSKVGREHARCAGGISEIHHLVNVSGHDADLASLGLDDAGAVGPDQARLV